MRWHKKAQPLPWYGGKQSKAEWLYNLIPWRKDSTYVEPFGGMAGLLCYRAPVKCEIFNDLDGRVVNWWKCVREHRDELGELVEAMPHSEAGYQWAKGAVDDDDESGLQRGLAFYTICLQAVAQSHNGSGWRAQYMKDGPGTMGRWRSERVGVLCERFWNVQLFCQPAEKLLTRVSDIDHAVIYADPPYHTADTSAYAVCKLDIDALTELFLAQRGQVAVSGYRDEWDHLEWQRHEKEYKISASARLSIPSTEVLWTNYDAADVANMGGGLFSQP